MLSRIAAARLWKRKDDPSELWDVIVNNDDVCFEHILPKLNVTDVKFLFEVNTETRALVKRSSRKDDLKRRFKVEEMSSISTLEFAWENRSSWPSWWNETYFCHRVPETNELELLKWIREEKKCEWNEGTISAAAYQGNIEMVKYCVANKCPSIRLRVDMLPKTVISSASNTYAKKSKRLGISILSIALRTTNNSNVYATQSKRNVQDGNSTRTNSSS